jgi:hypothetical protein
MSDRRSLVHDGMPGGGGALESEGMLGVEAPGEQALDVLGKCRADIKADTAACWLG